MALLHNDYFDLGMTTFAGEVEELHILTAEPLVYADVATNTMGVKANPTITGPTDRTGGGRELTVAAISDGSVTANGTPTHIALVDNTNSKLLAVQAVSSADAMLSGDTFTTTAFTIGTPDPA